MRAVLCACDISVRVGVHFWDVQLRAACGAPARGSTPRDRHVGPVAPRDAHATFE